MTISREGIDAAIRYCSAFQNHYRGLDPVRAGVHVEGSDQRDQIIQETWLAWSGFARTYFMAMLNILGGQKPLVVESAITKFCTPAEMVGGTAAIDVFWRRELALLGPAERRGAHSLNTVQRTILADDAINREVFNAVERTMENEITRILRSRRSVLSEFDPETDHVAGLNEDLALFFGGGRPVRLSANDRNENYDGALF